MTSHIEITHLPDIEGYMSCQFYLGFNLKEYYQSHPDRHLILLDEQRQPVAYCSLWWSAYVDSSVGLIGHFSTASREQGVALLQRACQLLAQQGCLRAIGPVDGSIWRRYRLVIETDGSTPFFGEPVSTDSQLASFVESGFRGILPCCSSVAMPREFKDQRVLAVKQRLDNAGVQIRSFNMDILQQELKAIYELTLASFKDNPLFVPLVYEEFVQMYLPLVNGIDPKGILMAEQKGELVGYLFSLPEGDPSDPASTSRLILKTLAAKAAPDLHGLGAVMADRLHEYAWCKGYQQVIHALMRENSHSHNLSKRYGKVFRRYQLYAKNLRD